MVGLKEDKKERERIGLKMECYLLFSADPKNGSPDNGNRSF